MSARKDRRRGTSAAALRLRRRAASATGDPYATVARPEPSVRRWVIGIVVALLAIGGWALVTGGVFDSPVAHTVRSASIWSDPAVGLDDAAARQVIGDRRLVIVVRAANATPSARDACRDLDAAAEGTVVVILTAEADDWATYGCQYLFDSDDDLGRAAVIEERVSTGVGAFPGRPLDAVRTIVVNYDLLVAFDRIPGDARTFRPSLPRYVLAGAALAAVVFGAVGIWWAARRAGRSLGATAAVDQVDSDHRAVLSTAMTAIAHGLLRVDSRPGEDGTGRNDLFGRYLAIAGRIAEFDRLSGAEHREQLDDAVRDADALLGDVGTALR
ncbi:MAG: hypothetical protein WKF57_14140 [Nakamurella sp.]